MARICKHVIILATMSAIPVLVQASAGAAATIAGDPFAGDGRFAIRRTLRFRDRTVRDLLADLNLQTGIRFFADSEVADDRVNLFTHSRPLSESLRELAGFLRFEWQRAGVAPDYGYTLHISAEARAEDARVRTDSAQELANRIADDAELY